MASNIKIATATRNAMLDAITSAIGSNGVLEIYDGTQPAGPGTAVTTQTLLVSLSLSATAAPAASNGVLTFNAITQTNASETGTASWYRVTTSGGAGVIDGTVGTSGADLNLNTTSIASGGPVSVTSFTYTAPGG